MPNLVAKREVIIIIAVLDLNYSSKIQNRYYYLNMIIAQLWTIDETILKNKANIWQSSDEWSFEINGKNIMIRNVSKQNVITLKDDNTVGEETPVKKGDKQK